MTLTIKELYEIGRYLNAYLGSFMFIIGICGSLLNLWLFTRHCFRKSPCARFILVSAVFDIIHLISALFFRILADGFYLDPASTSVIICRIRYYIITSSAYISVGCRCLAAFDRYICTSRSRSLRKWSSVKNAHRFIIANICLWLCFAFPNFFYFNLVRMSSIKFVCYISHTFYSNYFAYFVNPVLYFALPLIILISCAIKTTQHIKLMRQTRRLKRLERQMNSMIISQAVMNSISSIPYGIQFFYVAITLHLTKTPYQQAQEHLFLQITRLCYYINFISAFYIYFFSSKRIRSLIKSIFHIQTSSTPNRKETEFISDSSKSRESENFISYSKSI